MPPIVPHRVNMTNTRNRRRPEFRCPEATSRDHRIDLHPAPVVRFSRANEDPVSVLAPIGGPRIEWVRCPVVGLVRVRIG